MKRWISLLAVITMALTAMPNPVVHAEDTPDTAVVQNVQPYNLYGYAPTNMLRITGTSAYCESNASGYSNATKIVMTHYLEKKVNGSWTSIADWTKQTTTDDTLKMTTGRTGLASGTYRLRTVATYYCGSASEQLECISSSMTVS